MIDSPAAASNKQNDPHEEKVIPILGCPDIRPQVSFYQQLGFEVIEIYTSPNPYACVKLGAIELHFYGSKKVVPENNATMCYIRVKDVDAVHDAFAAAIKKLTGQVPRSGIPRFTTVRDLKQDRRFTLTDTGGNTLFIGSPLKAGEQVFLRTLENKQYAKLFTVLYDIVYSKEDPALAASNLPRYNINKALLSSLDKAKYLLVVLDIEQKLGVSLDDKEISALLKTHAQDEGEWEMIRKKYLSIMQEHRFTKENNPNIL